MFRHSKLCQAAVASTAALLLLSGCGSDGADDAAAASTAADESTADAADATEAETVDDTATDAAADPGDAAFCAEAESIFTGLEGVDTVAPADFTAFLDSTVEDMVNTPTPAGIADDWTTVAGALMALSSTVSTVDTSTPEGTAMLEAMVTEFQTSAGAAGTNVATYCGAGA